MTGAAAIPGSVPDWGTEADWSAGVSDRGGKTLVSGGGASLKGGGRSMKELSVFSSYGLSDV